MQKKNRKNRTYTEILNLTSIMFYFGPKSKASHSQKKMAQKQTLISFHKTLITSPLPFLSLRERKKLGCLHLVYCFLSQKFMNGKINTLHAFFLWASLLYHSCLHHQTFVRLRFQLFGSWMVTYLYNFSFINLRLARVFFTRFLCIFVLHLYILFLWYFLCIFLFFNSFHIKW